VMMSSCATTSPISFRHCAVTVPACQVTFQCTCPGSLVVIWPCCVLAGMGTVSLSTTWPFSTTPASTEESESHEFGIWSGPPTWPLISSRTEGQLLNALTRTLPERFQWFASLTTGLIEYGTQLA